MSAGANARLVSATGKNREAELADLMRNPQFMAAVNGYVHVDDTRDIPFLGGSDNAGRTIYVDRQFAEAVKAGKIEYEGTPIDPLPFIRLHEAVEGALIRLLGWSYNKAHAYATTAEAHAVAQAGLDWTKYQDGLKPWIATDEREKVNNPPPDLLEVPYQGQPQDREIRLGEGEQMVTKQEANYRDSRHANDYCAVCSNFVPPSDCRKVIGRIDPNGWCRYFSPASGRRRTQALKSKAKGGYTASYPDQFEV